MLVAAPVRKRLALAYISLELAAKDTTSDALHACLIGGWVSAAMYRRPFMSILQKAYKIQMSEVDQERPKTVKLPRSVAEELTLLAVLCPLMASDVSAPLQPRCYATDSSDGKGAVVSAPVSEALSRALCRSGRKKASYARMLSRSEAILKNIDEMYEEGLDETQGNQDDVDPERPVAFRFHFLDICGGAGKVAAAVEKYGWVVGPVIDLDRSRHFDCGALRVIAWLFHLIESGKLDSFMIAPPCTTFSPAQHPASRGYDRPRGYDPLDPKTLQGTTIALRALSLMMMAVRYNIPGLLEQPRRSKMRKLPEWEFLCSSWGASESVTASCMFGSIHKKEFVFLTSSLDTSLLTRTCDGQHKRIQIAGKWSKPSAVYTDELAAALGQSFDKALTKKIRRTQFVEPKLKGLESPLCNDVLLSAKWKVDKVWSWRSPKHINIQEVLAAERLMKEQAVSWPKSRFPVVVDSNVGMSALVKGRSPSDGLRPALRRAGSTIVAGALYPAYHFGPTRLLPADHPTPENEFPPPCRSCLPPEATCAELLQFSKVSNLARKGANWVRLVLLLLQNLPLWSLSKDSWRFAHVNYKHYPFSTQKADFSRKEFDSTRGYPGEGPTAGGSRVQLIRCLASVLPFGFPALVGLLGAFAALVGIFGAYISLAAFGLTSALPRKAVPVHVRSRFRPRSSSLTLFRQAKLQALFLAILFLEHPGLVAGAPRHGLKLQPRDAADRARQETRDQLELPDGRPVLGQTQRQRDKLMGAFEEWLRSQGILLDEILMVGAPDVEALNILLERYGRELYRAGRPYGHYSETVNAVSAKRPRVRRLLQPAWDLAYSWLRQEPPVHHLALPWQAMLSFLTTSLCWGWCRVAGIIALSWGGITRIGESVNAFRRDLVLPSDVNYTIDYVLLQIAEPKTRFRCARHQMAKVDQPQLVRIIVTAFENLRPDQRLWPASGSTIRSRFQRLVQANSLDHLRTKKGLDLGSLRAGGASWLLMTSDNPDMTRRRGRWINAKVMEVYVQEAWAVQFLPQLPKSIKEGIMEGAGLFPWALELAEIWKRAAVPESAWPILYQKAARDLEQQEMGRQHLEKEEAGDGGAAFAQCGRVHPSKDAEEKKCDQLDELTFNSECPVRRSSFSRKAAHPSRF